MSGFFLASASFLLATIGLGLWRVVRGPSPADRMVAAQLFGTTGIAIVLLIGAAYEEPAAGDIAIVFALLAALAAAAFVRCGHALTQEEPPSPAGQPQMADGRHSFLSPPGRGQGEGPSVGQYGQEEGPSPGRSAADLSPEGRGIDRALRPDAISTPAEAGEAEKGPS